MPQKLIVFIFSFLLFIEISHSIYFHTKVALNFDKHRSATYKEADYVYFNKMMQTMVNDNPGIDIITVSDGDEFYPLMTSYLRRKGIYDGYNLIKSLPAVKQRTILVFALYDPEMTIYQPFLTEQKAQLLSRVNNVNFYRVDLHP